MLEGLKEKMSNEIKEWVDKLTETKGEKYAKVSLSIVNTVLCLDQTKKTVLEIVSTLDDNQIAESFHLIFEALVGSIASLISVSVESKDQFEEAATFAVELEHKYFLVIGGNYGLPN